MATFIIVLKVRIKPSWLVGHPGSVLTSSVSSQYSRLKCVMAGLPSAGSDCENVFSEDFKDHFNLVSLW